MWRSHSIISHSVTVNPPQEHVYIPGHEAMEEVHIQNSEDAAFAFAFDDASCHSPGFANSLKVEPMYGVVPARGRLVN